MTPRERSPRWISDSKPLAVCSGAAAAPITGAGAVGSPGRVGDLGRPHVQRRAQEARRVRAELVGAAHGRCRSWT